MNRFLAQITLVILVAAHLPVATYAQMRHIGAATAVAPVTVTFTFQTTPSDYSVYTSDGNESRYRVRVPTSNIPSFKVTPSDGLRVVVDNDESTNDSLVFSITAPSGVAVRVDRSKFDLLLTFQPNPSGTNTANNGRERVTAAASAPAATTGPNPPNSAGSTNLLQPIGPAFDPDKKLLAFADADLAVPESPAFHGSGSDAANGCSPFQSARVCVFPVKRRRSKRQFSIGCRAGLNALPFMGRRSADSRPIPQQL